MTNDLIRLVVADDHPIFLVGLAKILSFEKDFQLLTSVADGTELIAAVEKHRPHVVISDLRMRAMHGQQACAIIKERWPETEIVVCTMYDSEELVCRVKGLGVRGYVLKTGDAGEVCKAIRTVHAGGDWYSPPLRKRLDNHFRYGRLGRGTCEVKERFSKTELQIIELFRQGCAAKEIAHLLAMPERTLQMHKEKIEEKAGVHGHVGIAVYATENWLRYEKY